MFEGLPLLGAGLSYQHELHDEIVDCRAGIDFLEIPTDLFVDQLPEWSDRLTEMMENFTTVAHGIYTSLGDAAGPHLDYLEHVAPFITTLNPVWFSDHLDMGNDPGDAKAMHAHGMPVPFTRAQVEVFRQNMSVAQKRIGLPLLVENLFYKFVIPMPGSLPEPVFIHEILEGTEHGLLLDVENLYVNSLNFNFDAYDWLEQAPLERAVEIHVAGGERAIGGEWAGKWLDSHSQPVPDEVWKLAEYVVKRAPVKAILLERGQRFPPMADLLAELEIARGLLAGASPKSDGVDSGPSLVPG